MDQLLWGLQITALGMGLVFALLAMLWGLLTLVLRLDKAPAPALAPATGTAAAGAAADGAAAAPAELAPSAASGPEGELLAAIVMAALAHRAVRRREAAPAMRSYWPGSLLYASRWLGAGRARQNQTWQRRGR
jgi:Na+-transporting methylmalonyl-CoA/oxaloacetate decarboxylase gamma subunit